MFRPTRSIGIAVVLAVALVLVEAAVTAEGTQRPIRSPTYPTPAPNLRHACTVPTSPLSNPAVDARHSRWRER